MSAVIAVTNVPAEIVVLSQDSINLLDAVIEQACAMAISDVPMDESDFNLCNAAYKRLGKLRVQMETERKALKAPLLRAGEAIDEASKEYQANLKDAEMRLGMKVKNYELEENRRRDAIARAARDESERQYRAQVEAQEADRAAKQALLPPGEELSVIDTAPVRVPVAVLAPPPIKSAVRLSTHQVLIIDNIDLVPVKIGNVRLLEINETAIKQVLRAGFEVAGCHLETREGIAPKGRG